MVRTFSNIFIVWFLTGLWHGASWNFIAWGMYFCFFLVAEKLGLLKILNKLPAFLRHIYALIIIYFGWLLFAWEDIAHHRNFVSAMAGRAGAGFVNTDTMYLIVSNVVLFIFLVIGSTRLPVKAGTWICNKNEILSNLLKTVFVIVVFLISVAYLVNGTYNPFLYFRF